jgi:hypothetical protein
MPRPELHFVGALCALLVETACATLPVPEVLTVARERETLAATQRARELAPQAFAHARKLRERADAAYEAGDRVGAEILGEHALAAYQRAVVQARLVRAKQRIQASEAALGAAENDLVALTRAQQQTEAEAKALELQVRVARDAEPLAPVEPAGPAREAARREAALSILEAARLLCLSARILEPTKDATNALASELDALERQLESRTVPTPTDRAMTLRAECLRQLTLTRRTARTKAPEADPTDELFVQLQKALPDRFPVRDDRGLVIVGSDLFSAKKSDLSDAGSKLTKTIAEVARANSAFPLLVVLHGPEDLNVARGETLSRALSQAGAPRAEVISVGSRIPSSLALVKGVASTPARVEFVLVAPQ